MASTKSESKQSQFQDMTLSQIANLPPAEPICTEGRWYPLHVLCLVSNQDNTDDPAEPDYLELLAKVLCGFPKATTLFTKEGLLPLHIICRNSIQNKVAIETVFNSNPEAAKVAGVDGWFPLHQVCRYSQSVDVTKLIYDAYPKAAKKRTEKGTYPHQLLRLNPACRNDKFCDAVIAACPSLEASRDTMNEVQVVEAVQMTGEELRAMSLAGRDDSRQYAISTNAFTETASTPMSGGLYLLHCLCQGSAPLCEVKEALDAFPQAVSLATDDGWLPLHLICRNSDNLEAIRFILAAYPEGAAVPTLEGWYPLHQLCRYSHNLDAIKMLYESHPAAAKAKTLKGSTPLHMLHKYYPLRADQKKNLINHDQNYKKDIILALSVNVVAEIEGETIFACAAATASEVVACAVEHSSYMDVAKFDDVCNLFNMRIKKTC